MRSKMRDLGFTQQSLAFLAANVLLMVHVWTGARADRLLHVQPEQEPWTDGT